MAAGGGGQFPKSQPTKNQIATMTAMIGQSTTSPRK
jgi:hypothetical protein